MDSYAGILFYWEDVSELHKHSYHMFFCQVVISLSWILYVMILILRVGYKNNPYIRKIQKNLIKSSLQTSLPYILL